MTDDVSHRRPMSHDEPQKPNTACLANIPGAEGPEGSEQCSAPVDTVGDLFCRHHHGRFDKPPSVRAGPSASACSGAPSPDAPEVPKPVRAGPSFPGSPPVRPDSGSREAVAGEMGTASGLSQTPKSPGGHPNQTSGSLGASARDSASGSPTPRSPGSRPSDRHAMLAVLVAGLVDSIWVLADKNPRTSADLHEAAISMLQEEEATDRRAAVRKARARGERS